MSKKTKPQIKIDAVLEFDNEESKEESTLVDNREVDFPDPNVDIEILTMRQLLPSLVRTKSDPSIVQRKWKDWVETEKRDYMVSHLEGHTNLNTITRATIEPLLKGIEKVLGQEDLTSGKKKNYESYHKKLSSILKEETILVDGTLYNLLSTDGNHQTNFHIDFYVTKDFKIPKGVDAKLSKPWTIESPQPNKAPEPVKFDGQCFDDLPIPVQNKLLDKRFFTVQTLDTEDLKVVFSSFESKNSNEPVFYQTFRFIFSDNGLKYFLNQVEFGDDDGNVVYPKFDNLMGKWNSKNSIKSNVNPILREDNHGFCTYLTSVIGYVFDDLPVDDYKKGENFGTKAWATVETLWGDPNLDLRPTEYNTIVPAFNGLSDAFDVSPKKLKHVNGDDSNGININKLTKTNSLWWKVGMYIKEIFKLSESLPDYAFVVAGEEGWREIWGDFFKEDQDRMQVDPYDIWHSSDVGKIKASGDKVKKSDVGSVRKNANQKPIPNTDSYAYHTEHISNKQPSRDEVIRKMQLDIDANIPRWLEQKCVYKKSTPTTDAIRTDAYDRQNGKCANTDVMIAKRMIWDDTKTDFSYNRTTHVYDLFLVNGTEGEDSSE